MRGNTLRKKLRDSKQAKRRTQQRHTGKDSASNKPRAELDVMKDLTDLTRSPGYIHALSALTFKSNVITSSDEFTTKDFLKIYQPDRLIRTETNLLIGLMLSAKVDVAIPHPTIIQNYIDQSILLLEELHQAIIALGQDVFTSALKNLAAGKKDIQNPCGSGVMLREAILYGGESAFPFQYKTMALDRYSTDQAWLQANVGFDIAEAAEVVAIIREVVNSNLPSHFSSLKDQDPRLWTLLPLFTFTSEEVAKNTSIPVDKINLIINTFSVYEEDADLSVTTIGCYNKAATHPFIQLKDGTLISFLEYSAFSALYENPFYWIGKDKKYLGQHSQTRGSFVESFTEKTLCRVFPKKYVFKNVVFKNSAGDTVGEADAILLYGFRAFIVQAKSKRLTLASWQGEDEAIAKDFQSAVQHAYDQAALCARHIMDGVPAFYDEGRIDFRGSVREFYPICITSEHYPALAFQSSMFLKIEEDPLLLPPVVTDIFTLDVMAEMLPTPMYFTDYLVKRAATSNKLNISHELVALSWYLKRNLHIGEHEFYALADDIMVDLDLAMAVRRTGISGKSTPEGQLTRFHSTPAGKILDHINTADNPNLHRLGEIILGMDGAAADELNKGISHIIRSTIADGGRHDITVGLEGGGGITVHCNFITDGQSRELLQTHCEMRKYVQKSDRWSGAAIGLDGIPILFMGLEFPWKADPNLEAEAAPFRVRSITHALSGRRKIGRNETCPCGSEKKYKQCCLN